MSYFVVVVEHSRGNRADSCWLAFCDVLCCGQRGSTAGNPCGWRLGIMQWGAYISVDQGTKMVNAGAQLSFSFPAFTVCKNLAQGMVPPISRGFSLSFVHSEPLLKHTQKVGLNLLGGSNTVNLTIKINLHAYFIYLYFTPLQKILV